MLLSLLSAHLAHLKLQFDDATLGWQIKRCREGQIGFLASRKMIPALEDDDLRSVPVKDKQINQDGSSKEIETSALIVPQELEAVRKLWTMFQNNLLMGLSQATHLSNLTITREDLAELYRFLDGPFVARRSPSPSASLLVRLERAVFKEIHIQVYDGKPFKEAMVSIIGDQHWWQREFYSKLEGAAAPPASIPSSSQAPVLRYSGGWQAPSNARQDHSDWYSSDSAGSRERSRSSNLRNWWDKGSGKGKQKDSAKGKSKGKSQSKLRIDKAAVDKAYADGLWARQMPNKKHSCIEHQKGECNLKPWETCGGNFQCPRILQNGQICGGHHRGLFCQGT